MSCPVRTESQSMPKPGTFQKGNKAAVGHRPATRPDICTQALISQLHEMDKSTRKEKIHKVCAQLIKNATEGGETAAIKEIFDRVQGRAPIQMDGDARGANIAIILSGMTPEMAADAYAQTLHEIG